MKHVSLIFQKERFPNQLTKYHCNQITKHIVNVIKALKGEEALPIQNLIDDILNFLSYFRTFSFSFIPRNLNGAADCLAQFSFEEGKNFEWDGSFLSQMESFESFFFFFGRRSMPLGIVLFCFWICLWFCVLLKIKNTTSFANQLNFSFISELDIVGPSLIQCSLEQSHVYPFFCIWDPYPPAPFPI